MKTQKVQVGELALNDCGAFKIGPFGSSLKKSELVGTGIPVVGIENILPNQFVKGFRRFITLKKFEELSDYEILPGDVLVTTMGTIGRAAAVPPGLGIAIFDSHLFRMRVDTNLVYPPYLCYAVNSDLVVSQLSQMARGAIMDGLNTTILRECEIPLPDLSEQKRTANLLQQADRLRGTRRYALQLSDTFFPAAFLEIFGDPLDNKQKWPVLTFTEVCEKITDGTHFSPPEVPVGVPYITAKNIKPHGIDLSDLTFVSQEHHREIFKRCDPRKGDVLYIKDGATTGLAKVNSLPFEFSMLSSLALLRPNLKKLLPQFLEACLNFPSMFKAITSQMKGGAIQRLTIDRIKELTVVVPPLPLQQKFASLVERYEKLWALQREESRQAEHLFQTLVHQAFKET